MEQDSAKKSSPGAAQAPKEPAYGTAARDDWLPLALRESESRYRLAFEHSPDSMHITRLSDGLYIDINPRFSELVGYDRDEVLGRTSLELDIWADPKNRVHFVAELHSTGQVDCFEMPFRCKDGTIKVGAMSSRLINLCGELCMLCVTRELERRQADYDYRLLVNNSFEGIAVIQDEHIRFANPRFARISGYDLDELEGMPISTLLHPEERDKILFHYRRLMTRRRGPLTYDMRGLAKNGDMVWLLMNAKFTEWEGRPAILVFFSDISAQKRTEEALRKSQALYQAIVEDQTELVCRFSPDTRLTFVNDAFAHFFGLDKDKLLGMPFLDLVPEADREDLATYLQSFSQERPGKCLEHRVLSVRGRETWLQRCDRALYESGRLVEFQCVGRDTTSRRLYEKQIVKSLQEKEILLREIHHRVKNNLQIVSSLLHLQSATDRNGVPKDMFTESQNRILTMALVHEELYRSDDLASIDLLAYIRKLLGRLLSAMGDKRRIQGLVGGEAVALTIDTAIPCGLIVNELVTNSLKHAFGQHETGRIRISVSKTGKDAVVEIGDTGHGLPPGLDFRDAPSLGLQLVSRLVKQLHGRIELLPEPGANFRITFPAR